MKTPRIKICGITNPTDAETAIAAGADYLGFVLAATSPRYLTLARALELVAEVRDRVKTVAVTVNPTEDEVFKLLASGFDIVQLHGDETTEFIRRLPWERVWKAVHLRTARDVDAAAVIPAGCLLVDSGGAARGGTGRTGDWALAAVLARRRPVFLAGGLRPENVRRALQAVRPRGVDVSSGVEKRPGRKDPDRLRAFVAAVRRDASPRSS